MEEVTVEIFPDSSRAEEGVDDRLLKLAKQYNGTLCTIDYNLNKVAQVEGIKVVNVNDLSKGLRMAYLPGEKLKITLTSKGNDSNQAVGHQALLVNLGKRLVESPATRLAAIATSVYVDTNPLAVHGQVFDHLLTATEAIQLAVVTMGARNRLSNRNGINVVVVLVLLQASNLVSRQVENVCRHSYISSESLVVWPLRRLMMWSGSETNQT
jgi:hypothetical protein